MQTNNTSWAEEPATMRSPEMVINQESGKKPRNFFKRCLDWWFRFAALPEPPANASFVQRDTARKMQFLSLTVLLLIFTSLLTVLVLLSQMGHISTLGPITTIIACFVDQAYYLSTLFICKKLRRPKLAGGMVTLGHELIMIGFILSNKPFNGTSFQEFGLLACGEMVAIILVSPQFTLLIGFCNSLFITFCLFFLPHDHYFAGELQAHFLDLLTGAVGLQIAVAFLTSWHINHLIRVVKRADRAQMIASLEHKMAEQQKAQNREMQWLADCISNISRQYSDIMNRRVIATISDEGLPDVLRPPVKGFNLLLSRLYYANQIEREYSLLRQALQHCTEQVYQEDFTLDHLPQTGTPLDQLLSAICKQHALHVRAQLQQGQPVSPSSPLAPHQNAQRPFER